MAMKDDQRAFRIHRIGPFEVLVVVSGALTASTGRQLQGAIGRALARSRREHDGIPDGTIVVDARGLRFVDEAGGSAMARALASVESAGASVVVLRAPWFAQMTFRKLGLEERFTFVDEVDPVDRTGTGRNGGGLGGLHRWLMVGLGILDRLWSGARVDPGPGEPTGGRRGPVLEAAAEEAMELLTAEDSFPQMAIDEGLRRVERYRRTSAEG